MTSHLQEYLDYYLTLEAPGFAVLVTGDWGTGKTFQVKKCIPDEKRLYISLFGVQTVEQLHSEVFAAAAPTLAKAEKVVGKGSDVVSGAGGLFAMAGAIPSVFNAVFKREIEPTKTLIFDDLERSDLELNDVLGAINSYVEHLNFRVVVVAHDERLTEGFLEMKEKTFGQTILVEPQVEQALDRFISDISDAKSRIFVTTHLEEIKGVFVQSGAKSLRVLRHVVEDLTRLQSTLRTNHQENADAMVELVQTFVAFAIEVRSGQLSEKDLRNRRGSRMGHMMRSSGNGKEKPKTPPFVSISEKYPTIDLEAGMLNDDVLVAMLIAGRYPEKEIQASIDNSSHFLVPGEVPAWKVVIHFDELDDETVEDARKRMEQQFENREVTDAGEMLHIFCLRMMMAENGIIDRSVKEVVAESKAYLDDLLKAGRLPPRSLNWRWYSEFERSYDGFGYWVSEAYAGHFEEIWHHWLGSHEDALRQTFPEVRDDLLTRVREDPQSFLQAVSPTSNGENPYASIPLLHEIPVDSFVDAWLSGRPEHWRDVDYALENRYSHGQLERDLKDELDWALGVLKELDARSEKETGFAALRIKRLKPRVLIALARSLEEGAEDPE